MFSGFEIFGMRVFDMTKPFSYFEAFSTIGFTIGVSFVLFLYLSKKASNK